MHSLLPVTSDTVSAMLCLAVVFWTSMFMFFVLDRRWTQRRGWIDLADWARDRRYQLVGQNRARLPIALFDQLQDAVPQVAIARPGKTATRLHRVDAQGTVHRLNILEREIEATWPTTALRPVKATGSIVDLFPLGNFPTLAPADRFGVLGLDASAARRLVRSSIVGLLPADVGLVIHGKRLLLEFSERPFDPIELDRLLALAEQVAHRLPTLARRA